MTQSTLVAICLGGMFAVCVGRVVFLVRGIYRNRPLHLYRNACDFFVASSLEEADVIATRYYRHPGFAALQAIADHELVNVYVHAGHIVDACDGESGAVLRARSAGSVARECGRGVAFTYRGRS